MVFRLHYKEKVEEIKPVIPYREQQTLCPYMQGPLSIARTVHYCECTVGSGDNMSGLGPAAEEQAPQEAAGGEMLVQTTT